MKRSFALSLATGVASLLIAGVASAADVNYLVTGLTSDYLGSDRSQGGDYDILALGDNSSLAGSNLSATWSGLTATAQSLYFQDWRFTAGYNNQNQNVDYPISFTQSLTVNGITKSFTQSGNININDSDNIKVNDSNTLYFDLGAGQELKFTALGYSAGPNNGSAPLNGTVLAQVSVQPVPEPITMTIAAAGLGLAARRRKSVKA